MKSRSPHGLQTYFHDLDIHNAAFLSRDDEADLAARICRGDLEARDHLVRANLRLVISVARRHLGRGLPIEDLIAEGNLGLIRAVESYDGRPGVCFGTYATFWIEQALRRALMNQARPIRLPTHAATLLKKWRRAARALAVSLGRVPSFDEVTDAMNLTECKRRLVADILEVDGRGWRSAEAFDRGSGPIAFVADARGEAAEDNLIGADERAWLLDVLGMLPPREATVLRMRFGLAPYKSMFLGEIGKVLGLTREGVRQIEKRAMTKLTAALEDSARAATDPSSGHRGPRAAQEDAPSGVWHWDRGGSDGTDADGRPRSTGARGGRLGGLF
jgi:RNA polymerase primary sigma factor